MITLFKRVKNLWSLKEGVVREITVYFLFLICLTVSVAMLRDTREYSVANAIQVDLLNFSDSNIDPDISKNFYAITDLNDFWIYLHYFVWKIHANRFYNGKVMEKEDKAFVALASRTISAIEWKQERIKFNIGCEVSGLFESTMAGFCLSKAYTEETKNNAHFEPNATLVNKQVHKHVMEAFHFDVKSNGFTAIIPNGASMNESMATTFVSELKRHKWVDKYTHAVHLSFNIYNPEVGVLVVCRISFLFQQYGSIKPSATFRVLSIR